MNLKKIQQIQSKLYAEGKIDSRKIFSFANAKKLPQGYGLIGIGVKDDNLVIFDADMGSNVGEKIYEIPMSEIEKLKAGAIFGIMTYMKFTYCGAKFNIQNFSFKIGLVEAVKHGNSKVTEQ